MQNGFSGNSNLFVDTLNYIGNKNCNFDNFNDIKIIDSNSITNTDNIQEQPYWLRLIGGNSNKQEEAFNIKYRSRLKIFMHTTRI